MKIGARIRSEREAQRMSQAKLAALSGVKQQMISKLETGESASTGNVVGLARALNVNPWWLQSGDGPKRPTAAQSQPDSVSDDAGAWCADNVELAPAFSQQIPLISWVSAGAFAEAIDNFLPGDAEEWLQSPIMMSKNSFALRVVGNSMQPEFPPGRIILVDPELRGGIVPGDFVVARMCDGNDVTFKQYDFDAGRHMLLPLNKDYSPITDPFDVIGKVVADMTIRK